MITEVHEHEHQVHLDDGASNIIMKAVTWCVYYLRQYKFIPNMLEESTIAIVYSDFVVVGMFGRQRQDEKSKKVG